MEKKYHDAVFAEAAAEIEAPPERVYAVLADYRVGHPAIVPPQFFTRVEVERGGQGEGTLLRVGVRQLGRERLYRMAVTEPMPGRVLVEADEAAGVVTSFTVTPLDNGRRCRVRIATQWAAKRGLTGLLERAFNPSGARLVYRKQLHLLAEYVRAGEVSPAFAASPGG